MTISIHAFVLWLALAVVLTFAITAVWLVLRTHRICVVHQNEQFQLGKQAGVAKFKRDTLASITRESRGQRFEFEVVWAGEAGWHWLVWDADRHLRDDLPVDGGLVPLYEGYADARVEAMTHALLAVQSFRKGGALLGVVTE